MIIRKATSDDMNSLLRMAEDFKNASPYRDLDFDPGKVKKMVELMLASENFVIFVAEDHSGNLMGMVAGMCGSPLLFTDALVASEIVWWVDESHRNDGVGFLLKVEFEEWAKTQGCSILSMVCLEDENLGKVDHMYKQFGMTPSERSYFKVI